MMMFSVFEISTGELVRTGECQDIDFEQQAKAGEVTLEGTFNRTQHYCVNGAVHEYTNEQSALKAVRPAFAISWSNADMAWLMQTEWDVVSQLKTAKWVEIKGIRSQKDYSPLTVGEHTFDANQESQQKIAGAVQLALIAGPNFTIDWTLTDNSVHTFTQAEMIQVGIALGQRTSSIYGVARQLREAIDAATSIEAVAAVTWIQ